MKKIFVFAILVLFLLMFARVVDAIFLNEWKGCGSCQCVNPFGVPFCSVTVGTTGCYAHCQCGLAEWTCHQDCNLCEGPECSFPCEVGSLVACNTGLCEFNCGASFECDGVNNAPRVVVVGGFCDNCIFTACTWGVWTDDVCGGAPCLASQMRQTRTTSPVGCTTSTQCVNDVCTPWVNDACGAAGCATDEMHQTRDCPPNHCDIETQCSPACGAWIKGNCGVAVGCNPGEREQQRTCPPGCSPDTQCFVDPTCGQENNYPNGCTNGIDDEGDGCTDGQDSDCGGRETDCIDSRDNDCDGFTDGNDPDCPAGIITFENPLEAGTIPEIIAAIGDFIFFIGLGLVILMIIIAGIMFMTAGGDPYKISKAKNLLFWVAIGAAITLFSKGVSAIIRYLLGG